MRHHLRLVAILAICVLAYGVLLQAFRLMSQPSNHSLYAGIAIIFGLILLFPLVIQEIWRRL